MAIDHALRTHCGISGKQYFVAVILEDGTPATFFSPGQKLNDNVVHQFFNPRKFQEVAGQLELVPSQPLNDFHLDTYTRTNYGSRYAGPDRRRLPGGDDDDDGDGIPPRPGRKRHRARHPVEDDNEAPAPVMHRRRIRVQDSQALWNFYDQRFKSCQQSACKLIAKAWVKAVEPKKQSTHPYTGSDEKAPDWWPKPWGPTKEDKVRHKEPDHLYKRERVHLLNHILSLVIEPNEKQHRDIQKLNLSVKKLEECTNEALSGFYAESATNASKKQFLNEIFKVAKQQERYKNGEIDGAVEVYVLDNDRAPLDDHPSENDGNSLTRDEDEVNHSPSTRSATQGFLHTPGTGHSPATNPPHSGSFLNELPMRGSQQAPPPPVLHDLGGHHHHGFVEGGMPVNGAAPGTTAMGVDMVPGPQDASRRPSVYSDYSSVSNGGGMYTQTWQPSTSAPDAQSLYAHQANPQTQAFVQPVSVSHTQSYVPSTFVETMPRQGYDPNHGQMFRAGEVQQPPAVNQQQGYGYLPNDGRQVPALPGVSEVIDSAPRGHLQ